MSHDRGAVWYAAIPGVGDKPVLIVSAEPINWALANVIVARLTTVARERSIPTAVELGPDEIEGLPARSFVVCHDLFTLPKKLLRRRLGRLGPRRVIEVEAALRRALDL